jgi:hypothetical protein
MDKQTMSYKDFLDMVQALTLAVGGSLISHEDARFIMRKHLLQAGWKQQPTEVKKEVTKK